MRRRYKTDRLSRGGGPGWAPLVAAFEAAGRDPDRAVATTGGRVSEFQIGIRSAMDCEESKKTLPTSRTPPNMIGLGSAGAGPLALQLVRSVGARFDRPTP